LHEGADERDRIATVDRRRAPVTQPETTRDEFMDILSEATMRRIAVALYLIAALFLLTPVLDFVASVWPLRIHDIQWRFATGGLLSGYLLTPLLGLLLAMIAAALVEHRGVQRSLGVLSIVVAVALIGIMGVFTLDVLQLRGDVNPQLKGSYQLASSKALIKYVSSLVAFVWMAIISFRISAKPALAKAGKQLEADPIFVVQQSRRATVEA
jgi:hypothetical protein